MTTKPNKACCDWETFKEGFLWYHSKFFGLPPDVNAWRVAKREWKSGNTGCEAAHNFCHRATSQIEKSKEVPL